MCLLSIRRISRLAPLAFRAFLLTLFLSLGLLSSGNAQDAFFDRLADPSDVEPDEVEPAKVDFEKDVIPLLERRCANCHMGDRAKGGFEIDDRDAVLGYIEPGDKESSILWTDYLNADSAHVDPTTLVMPLNGPISGRELSVIEDWIEQGADWPETVRFVSAAGVPANESQPFKPEGLFQRITAFAGYFHPAIVHFPIALLVFGGAAAALSFLTGGRAIYVAYYCLIWGTLFSVVATYVGWCYAIEKGYPDWMSVPTGESIEAASAIFRHRWLGTFATLMGITFALCAAFSVRKPQSSFRHVWRVGLIVTALVISIVGHQGGELVYGDIIAKAFSRLLGN